MNDNSDGDFVATDHVMVNVISLNNSSQTPLINEIRSKVKRFQDVYLFMYSLVIMTLSIVSCSLAIAYTNYVDSTDYPNYKPRLHDIIIDHIPQYIDSFKFTEYSIQMVATYFILLLIIHRSRLKIMRRYLLIMASIYSLRALCLLSTQLSVPHTRAICPDFTSYGANEIISVASSAALTFGMVNRGMLSCGDYLFSGHTAALLTLALFITHYSIRNVFLLLVMWSITIAGIVCIITSFMHYTIDVVIAIFVTAVIFGSYHLVSQIICTYNAGSVDPSSLNRLSKLKRYGLYFNFLAYVFESNCTHFTNEYECWFDRTYDRIIQFFRIHVFRRFFRNRTVNIDFNVLNS